MIEHKGLEKLIIEMGSVLGFNSHTCALQIMSLGFDGFVWDCLGVLSFGGCLKLLDIEKSNLTTALEKEHEDITYFCAPPSLVLQLSPDHFKNLQVLLIAGERCSNQLLENWLPYTQIFNAYGPSEATIACTIFQCDLAYPVNTIGKAFNHCDVLILDDNLNKADINQPGEIYIGGGVSCARIY